MPGFIKTTINAWQKINLSQKLSILTLIFLLLVLPLALVSALNPTRLFGRAQTLTVTTLYFSPSNINADPSSTLGLGVFMKTGQDSVAAAEIHINFDKDFVEAQSVEILDFLPIKLKEPTLDNSSGKITFALGSDPSAPRVGIGQIARITFRLTGQTGQSVISFARDKTKVATLKEAGNAMLEMMDANLNIKP